jgi:hypothetical protein
MTCHAATFILGIGSVMVLHLLSVHIHLLVPKKLQTLS